MPIIAIASNKSKQEEDESGLPLKPEMKLESREREILEGEEV